MICAYNINGNAMFYISVRFYICFHCYVVHIVQTNKELSKEIDRLKLDLYKLKYVCYIIHLQILDCFQHFGLMLSLYEFTYVSSLCE